MRHRPAFLLLPALLLAGCGSRPGNDSADGNKGSTAEDAIAAAYELPDGRFDRARFRTATADYCRTSLQSAPEVPPGSVPQLCDCATFIVSVLKIWGRVVASLVR